MNRHRANNWLVASVFVAAFLLIGISEMRDDQVYERAVETAVDAIDYPYPKDKAEIFQRFDTIDQNVLEVSEKVDKIADQLGCD